MITSLSHHRYILGRIESRDSKPIHAAQVTIGEVETAQGPVDRWRDKPNVVCPDSEMDFVVWENESVIHTTTWMNLKHLMPCERSQTQKVTYCDYFMWNVQKRQTYRDRQEIGSCQELGWMERGRNLAVGAGIYFGVMGMFWNRQTWWFTHCEHAECHRGDHFKRLNLMWCDFTSINYLKNSKVLL